jgi:hypothetical protein
VRGIGWRAKLGTILAFGAVTAAALTVLLASGPSDAASDSVSRHAVATREARRLIAAVRVPRAVASTPSGSEARSALAGIVRATGPEAVQHSAGWTVPASAASVRAFLDAHPPRGTRRAPGSALTFVAVGGPRGLALARVVLTVVATGAHTSAVHARALVRWLVARSPSERVPAGARELEITRGPPGRPPTLVIDVTAPARVARIAALLDRLAPVQPGRVYHCPAQFAQVPVVSFVFHGRARQTGPGPLLAVASEQADVRSPTTACDAMRFTVAGRRRTPLLGGGRLLRQVGALLGRRLWLSRYAA